MTVVDNCGKPRGKSAQKTFQSLFLWMTVVDEPGWANGHGQYRVSILVLVDDGRRQHTVKVCPRQASHVSILVLVDDGRRLKPVGEDGLRGELFQSLFLWMTVVDQPPQYRRGAT